MTQYLLSLPHDSAEEPTMESMAREDPAALEALFEKVGAFNTALLESDALVAAGGLQPPSTAITVDATGERPRRTAGPFAQADQYLCGFWLIQAADQEAALAWAEQASAATGSRIEVRALQEGPQ